MIDSTQTLASIVNENLKAVPILEKYNLDFCCKGKRTLLIACQEKGLIPETILEEIRTTSHTTNTAMPFSEMSAEQLITYILIHHHFYVKQSMPGIADHLIKVVTKHGDKFPFMKEVLELFLQIKEDMTLHMQKEEAILFPRIKQLEIAFKSSASVTKKECIKDPINMMEHEHDIAGDMLYKIRRLTNNYTPPEEACTTFQVTLNELKEFEEDLHRHVHIENNILFPLALKMVN